jgi:hypothetical protein
MSIAVPPVTGAKTKTVVAPTTLKAAAKPKTAATTLSAPRPNPLFEYANYTYSLSMHVVPPKKYNELMNGVVEYIPTYDGVGTVLIASGGRRAEGTFGRHPRFNEDFFFEGFKMATVVGLSSRTKNTNSIEMSFTIVEPYGITLFDRLLGLSVDTGIKNWMEMPFLMGVSKLPDQLAFSLPVPTRAEKPSP